jgi:caffeoyl-CoA O-methyltransferase
MEMTPDRWEATDRYLHEVFGRVPTSDPLSDLLKDATARDMPSISVGPVVGRLLMILTSMTRGRLALELGTLGGYSAICIARGLNPRGRLITIEIDPGHADFAERWFRIAGESKRIELRRGAALDLLPDLAREIGSESLDLIFIDAEKAEYPEYWRLARPLIAPGGLIVIDNALGSSSWWIDVADHPARRAVDHVNRSIASDPEFEAVAIALRQGMLLARRVAPDRA